MDRIDTQSPCRKTNFQLLPAGRMRDRFMAVEKYTGGVDIQTPEYHTDSTRKCNTQPTINIMKRITKIQHLNLLPVSNWQTDH